MAIDGASQIQIDESSIQRVLQEGRRRRAISFFQISQLLQTWGWRWGSELGLGGSCLAARLKKPASAGFMLCASWLSRECQLAFFAVMASDHHTDEILCRFNLVYVVDCSFALGFLDRCRLELGEYPFLNQFS